ncbi:cell envelope integrity protein CreD [Parasalinivibrio latis]|uniref:hypothetical protein n=1 Tax=Parasalinivibrio latis TaxID=2952610 RepID=UPI0030DF2167
MESRILKIVVKLGVPGLALGIFYLLLNSWGFTFSIIGPTASAAIAALFIVIVGLITYYALKVSKQRKDTPDDVLGRYENLKIGLSSPFQNVEQIQLIANSSDPNRKRYLQELSGVPSISFLEVDAISEALKKLDSNKKVGELFQSVSLREKLKIVEMIPETEDPLFHPIMSGLKYWRYVNRKTHPDYEKINILLGNATVHQRFTPEEQKLAQEIIADEQGRLGL